MSEKLGLRLLRNDGYELSPNNGLRYVEADRHTSADSPKKLLKSLLLRPISSATAQRMQISETPAPRHLAGATATPVFRGWVLLAAAHLATFALPAQIHAQDPASDRIDAAFVRALVERIDKLESELREVKGRQIAASPIAAPPRSEAPLAAAEVAFARDAYPLVQFHGFADVQYRASDRAGQKNSFSLGQLDFFLTSRLSEDVSVLVESVVEANGENQTGFEVERLLAQYKPNDAFNLALGRSHTAIGWYNNAYHHGTWFQTSTGRPFIFNFEDNEGILPTHNVGLSASGLIPSGSLGLHYVAEIGNGRDYSMGKEPVLTFADNNRHKAVNLALFARPSRWPGLQGGVSVYHDRLTTDGLPEITQTIFTGHLIYSTPGFEWLNEGMLIRQQAAGSRTVYSTSAFYTQLAKQFGPLRPFARYQYLNAPARDPLFCYLGMAGTRHGPSVGVRYDFTELTALKLQFDHYFEPGNTTVNQFTLQVGFTF